MKSKEGYWTKRQTRRNRQVQRRWRIIAVVVCLLFFSVAYLFIQGFSHQILRSFNTGTGVAGVVPGSVVYGSSRPALPFGAMWKDVRGLLQLSDILRLDVQGAAAVSAKSLVVQITGFFPTRLSFAVKAASMKLDADSSLGRMLAGDGADSAKSFDFSLVLNSLTLDIEIPDESERMFEGLLSALIELARGESANRSVQCHGEVNFVLRKQSQQIPFFCKSGEFSTQVLVDGGELQRVSQASDLNLTHGERVFLETHPFFVPIVLVVSERSRIDAMRLHAEFSAVSEDAFRHLLWSYRLARSLGELHAWQITTAHEQGDSRDPTSADRRKDLMNNRIGIRYWKKGACEAEMLEAVKNDQLVER